MAAGHILFGRRAKKSFRVKVLKNISGCLESKSTNGILLRNKHH